MIARPPAAKASRRHPAVRDIDETPFTPILLDLVRRVPGALGAVLVDAEGETVDYAGHLEPFDLKVAAAHWQIVLVELAPLTIQARQITIRSERRSYILRCLPERYALVILLSRRAGFTPTTRALAACETALAREASWPAEKGHRWIAVEVVVDRKRRPREVTLREGRHALEVLGTLIGLRARERGFRVRLATGAELNLVREPGGRWYADET